MSSDSENDDNMVEESGSGNRDGKSAGSDGDWYKMAEAAHVYTSTVLTQQLFNDIVKTQRQADWHVTRYNRCRSNLCDVVYGWVAI